VYGDSMAETRIPQKALSRGCGVFGRVILYSVTVSGCLLYPMPFGRENENNFKY
jgi:hypothetical protein